ncbi:MAG: hypothetical protein U1F67_15985 [Rubrivivax sp.]
MPRIEHQQHRCGEQPRDGGVAVAAVERQAVVGLVAFDQRQISAFADQRTRRTMASLSLRCGSRLKHEAAAGERRPHRVDVVQAPS